MITTSLELKPNSVSIFEGSFFISFGGNPLFTIILRLLISISITQF